MVRNFLKLYNHEQKVRFLEEEYPNEATRQTYASLLISAAKFEEDKNKDLCDFSYSDAVDLMIGLKKKTFKSIDVAQTILIKYVDWAMREGYSKTNFNAFKLLSKDDLRKYTHQIALKKSYIDRERLYELASYLYNDVDKALLVLPFEGVRGRSEIENTFEEIRNLKMSDIFPASNTIIVTRNNDESRAITVDQRTMDILVRAMEQEDYHKSNGEAKGVFAIRPLTPSQYLMRSTEMGQDNQEDKIASQTINTRFRKYRDYTGVSFLNPTLVFQSGMIEKCAIKEKEVGELTPENYREIYREAKLEEKAWANLREIYESYKKNNAPK